jgi:hypothetical protein
MGHGQGGFSREFWHFTWRIGSWGIEGAAMTRPAIERCIKVFIVALVVTFGWTLTRVAAMLGWF